MSSTTVDLLWSIVVGTSVLLILGAGFIASLVISHRRYVAAQMENMEALRESELRFRNLVENISEIYCVCDVQGKLRYGSPNLFSESGYSEQELLGRSYVRLIADSDRRRVSDFYRARGVDGTVDTRLEFLACKRDGSAVWVEQSTRILRDRSGNILAYQNVVRDVTERKRTELLLAERESFLRTIIEAEPECVKLLDEHGNLLSINKAGLAMIEAESAELVLGKCVYPLVTPVYRDKFVDLTQRIYRGESGTLEFEMIGLRGTRRWLETHAVPLRDQEGTITAALGITRDISIRKQAEETLRLLAKKILEAQELERKRISRELHDSIGQMLSSVKFRLHGVIEKRNGSVRLHRRELSVVQSLLDKTLQEVRRISQNLRPSILDDLGLVSAVRSLCEDFEKDTKISVISLLDDLPKRLPPDVELVLFRIIQETLSNVEKHSQATQLALEMVYHDSLLDVIIRDNGKGFHPRVLKERHGSRRGLGLDSIEERAASIGASVHIESSPGQGSEIIVHIPLHTHLDSGQHAGSNLDMEADS